MSPQNAILFDPQTSGGILACVENHKVSEITKQLFTKEIVKKEKFNVSRIKSAHQKVDEF